MTLEEALNKWAKSKEGQAALNHAKWEVLRTDYEERRKAERTAEWYANAFKQILNEELSQYGWDFASWLHICNTELTKQGSLLLELDFDETKNQRDSLQPGLYPEGVYDLVALLNHGYDASGMVYGRWESKQIDTWSLPHREGLYFIQKAVEKFNTRYGAEGGAVCEYNPKYD